MNTTEKITKFLDEEKIVYFKRKIDDGSIILLPYSLVKMGLKIEIQILAHNEISDSFRMYFTCKKSEIEDISENLLELNAELPAGSLSMQKRTDEVKFSTIVPLGDKLEKEIFDKYIVLCLYTFTELYKKNLIDKKLYEASFEDE